MSRLLPLYPMSQTNILGSKGSELYTDKGHTIIDLQAGIWCTNIGHQHEHMLQTLEEQMKHLIHLNGYFPVDIADTLIAELGQIMGIAEPSGNFLSSGSEAVLLGLKICRLHHPDKKLLTFNNAYLNAYNHEWGDDWITVDYQHCLGCSMDTCQNCPVLTSLDFSSVGAFILETVNSKMSTKPPRKLMNYLLTQLDDDTLFMANEVTNGFGRTGKWFGYMHYDNFHPDIVSLGKGLGNGYPISGIIVSEKVARIVQQNRLVYVQSHQNDPLGCHVGLSVIQVIQSENLIKKSAKKGQYLLREIQGCNHPFIHSTRGHGLLISISIKDGLAQKIADRLLDEGFFIGCFGDVLHIAPPLNIRDEDLEKFIHVFSRLEI